MRVELNQQGTYQIRPNGMIARAQNVRPVQPAQPVERTSRTADPQQAEFTHEVQPGTTISRGRDVAELQSLDFARAQQRVPAVDQFHARIRPLVAGRVNQPISFDPPATSSSTRPMNIYDRAYFRHTADHASLNAAAVEREQHAQQQLDVEA